MFESTFLIKQVIISTKKNGSSWVSVQWEDYLEKVIEGKLLWTKSTWSWLKYLFWLNGRFTYWDYTHFLLQKKKCDIPFKYYYLDFFFGFSSPFLMHWLPILLYLESYM